jgi:PAS domain S-box-containing protein
MAGKKSENPVSGMKVTIWLSVSVVVVISIVNPADILLETILHRGIMPEWILMNTISSICFLIITGIIVINMTRFPDNLRKYFSKTAGSVTITISILTLYVYLFSYKNAEESSLTSIAFLRSFLAPDSRMSFISACNFLLLGIASYIMPVKIKNNYNVIQLLTLPVFIVSYIIPLSCLFGIRSSIAFNEIPVTWNAGISFCLLVMILMLMDTNTRIMNIFSSKNAGSILARKILPVLLFIPVISGIIHLLIIRDGVSGYGDSFLIIEIIFSSLFLIIIYFTASLTNTIDKKRLSSEETLKKAFEELDLRIKEKTYELTSFNLTLKNEINVCKKTQEEIESERKNIENELVRSQKEWAETFDRIPDLIAIIDKNHKILRANKSMLDKLNLSSQEIIGKSCYYCIHGNDRPHSECPHTMALIDGKQHILEIHDDNMGGDFIVSDTPFFDNEGKMIGSVHVARDITEWKISEKKLEKHSKRLELLSDVANKLLLSKNPQKTVDEICNQVMSFLDYDMFFYYTVDDITNTLHLNAYAGIMGEDIGRTQWLDFDSVLCGLVARAGVRILSENIEKSEDKRTDLIKSLGLKAYACYPLLSGNKVIGTLSFGTKTRPSFSDDDLSLMKIVADQLATALSRMKNENDLRESEDRFRNIAESLPVQIFIKKASDSTILFTNESYNNTFGFHNEELIGRKEPDIYYDKLEYQSLIRYLLEKGAVSNMEIRAKRNDGSIIWLLTSVQIIKFGGEDAFLGASIDISEIKKTRDKLVQLNRTLNSLGRSSQAIMHSENETQYVNEICKIIIEDCGHAMVWIGYAQNDAEKTVKPVASYGFDNGYTDNLKITWDNSETGLGPTGTAIRTGKFATCININEEPSFEPWRREAQKRGFASSLVLPLISDGITFGAITIYSMNPDAFSEKEISLLTDLANDLSHGISYMRLTEIEKKAAKYIKENEEKYRLLFEGMTEGFALLEIVTDKKEKASDFRFISINPAFEKQTGLRSVDIIGKTITEILTLSYQSWIEPYKNVTNTGNSTDFEIYIAELESYFRISAFVPKNGYLAILILNITDRILADEELRSTKNYLENLINYANAPIIVWNTKSEINLFNHAFEELTGYSSEEVAGKKLDFLFPKDSLKESKSKIRHALTENWKTIEIPIITKEKEIRIVSWNSAKIYNPDNKTVNSTIAQGTDITERIKAEQEVLISKEKLDLALENGNIGIWEWDIVNDEFEWDKRMMKMFGINNDAIINKFENFENCIYSEDVPHVHRAFQDAIKKDIPFDTIFRVKVSEEDFNYISVKALVQKDEKAKAVKMTGVCFDITEMKKGAEQALFRLNEDLMRSNKELEQFAYVASHDLQEPLRMVSSFTQLLSKRYKDKLDQDANEYIQYAVEGAIRMQTLINDLLEYSRIGTKGKKISAVDMQSVLKQALDNLSLKINEKNADITIDDLPVISADGGQMIQLFQNLIGNALKFCNTSPKIHISVKEDNEFYNFSVSDNGIGIEPQYFEKIFQIFQRLHLRNEYGGTGIGLAICRRIAERHGGRIWVESKYGEGSVFHFTIRKV